MSRVKYPHLSRRINGMFLSVTQLLGWVYKQILITNLHGVGTGGNNSLQTTCQFRSAINQCMKIKKSRDHKRNNIISNTSLPQAWSIPIDGQGGVLPHPQPIICRLGSGFSKVLHHSVLNRYAISAHVHLTVQTGVNSGNVISMKNGI